MSNGLRYDPIQVHYLAHELDRRLAGKACAAAPRFAPDHSATLPFEGGLALRADLHPDRGWVRLVEETPDSDGDELDALCTAVFAPPDERILQIEMDVTSRFGERTRRLTLELHTNQWNAVLTDGDGMIVNLLRGRRAGRRTLAPGQTYVEPVPRLRFGTEAVDEAEARERWNAAFADPDSRRLKLVREFAWLGDPSLGWIGSSEDSEEGFRRWWWLRTLPPAQPGMLTLDGNPIPYPLALRGVEREPAETLLAAMDRAASAVPEPLRAPDHAPALRFAEQQAGAARRKLERLEAQFAEADDSARLRGLGDLLLARLHEVPRGAERVELEDWEGGTVEIDLDPTLSPADNAAAYYHQAGRRERARDQLPALIETARREIGKWEDAAAEIQGGTVPEWVAKRLRERHRKRDSGDEENLLPYRSFRTSGGLEVRVGRNSKSNDRLTFHESSPGDIWLHARQVPGSHVILRWKDPDGAPPARDLAEAAQLAAVHSKARTSGTVAVDWTRRKYVRKPRGAAPGLVIPQQVKTLFVEPDESLVKRLAVDD